MGVDVLPLSSRGRLVDVVEVRGGLLPLLFLDAFVRFAFDGRIFEGMLLAIWTQQVDSVSNANASIKNHLLLGWSSRHHLHYCPSRLILPHHSQ
jgi:hypothetical protein